MELSYIIWAIIIFAAIRFRKGWYGQRLEKITAFYREVSNICEEYDEKHAGEILSGIKESSFVWVFESLPETEHLIFSFKKLNIESWLTDQQVEELWDGTVDYSKQVGK